MVNNFKQAKLKVLYMRKIWYLRRVLLKNSKTIFFTELYIALCSVVLEVLIRYWIANYDQDSYTCS